MNQSKPEDQKKRICGFCYFNRQQSESERKQKAGQILGAWQKTKKAVEHEENGGTYHSLFKIYGKVKFGYFSRFYSCSYFN